MKTIFILLSTCLSLISFSQNNGKLLEIQIDQNLTSGFVSHLDNQQLEYATCGLDSLFYLTLIDSNCQVLHTNFNGNHPNNDFGNLNNNGGCRQRSEAYFVFDPNQNASMESLYTLLSNLPAKMTYALSTPRGFDYNQLNATHPNLALWLSNKFGAALNTAHYFTAMEYVGDAQRIQIDTLMQVGTLNSSLEICRTGLANYNSNAGKDEPSTSTASVSLEKEEEILVYPNPSSTKIFLQNLPEDLTKIQLHNTLGEVVFQSSKANDFIDVSALTPGLYILEIVHGNESSFKRIIVQ